MSQDDPQVERTRQCLAEMRAVLERHRLSGCIYVAHVEQRQGDCFALYGETQSFLWHLSSAQKRAMAMQAVRHVQAVADDMARDSGAAILSDEDTLAALKRVANSDMTLH